MLMTNYDKSVVSVYIFSKTVATLDVFCAGGIGAKQWIDTTTTFAALFTANFRV